MYPCPTPSICGVQSHREQENCRGISVRENAKRHLGLNANLQSAVTNKKKVDLSSIGANGVWEREKDGTFSQDVDSKPQLGFDEYYHYMASKIEIEDSPNSVRTKITTVSNMADLPYADAEFAHLSQDEFGVGPSTYVDEDDNLQRHIDRHKNLAEKHNQVFRKEQLNPTEGFSNFGSDWIPTTNLSKDRVERKKKVILRDEMNINHPNVGSNYGDDRETTEKIHSSVSHMVAYDGRVEARNPGYENLIQFKSREDAISEVREDAPGKKLSYEEWADLQLSHDGSYDFRNSPAFEEYKDNELFKFEQSRVSAPIYMADELEQAVNEHNKFIWGDSSNVPHNRLERNTSD